MIRVRKRVGSQTQKNIQVNDVTESPSKLKVWVIAARPQTLTASIAPVVVGYSIVQYHQNKAMTENHGLPAQESVSVTSIAVVFAIFACLIQLGTNLHNDYADFIKGSDTDKRVGQARATQKGWLTPKETASGATFCLILALFAGSWLTALCEGDPYLIFVTITSAFNAVAYTGGPYPLGYIGLGNLSIGYSGLGDIFVFLYFGLVATVTVPYIYLCTSITPHNSKISSDHFVSIISHELFRDSFVLALPIGFLGTAIIVVNNLRDRITDVHSGKKTLAVRFGEKFTRLQYITLVWASYLYLIPLSRIFNRNYLDKASSSFWLYLPLLSYPMARIELKAMGLNGKDGAALNPHVGGTAKVQFLYCLLLSLSLKVIN